MSECIAPHGCVLDEKSREEISKAICEAIENDKPKIANVAVANFDGTIAYTLKKRVGGNFCPK